MMDKPSPKNQARRPRSAPSITLWRLSGLWVEILASIVGLGLVGYGMDRWLKIFPWLTVAGVILGVIGGMYNAIKKAMVLQNSRTNDPSKP
ncbi:MAG: AtpZ/AtpI family protein [Phycisphaerales bacterium]|nr:AtpZ/AtpI family protein [Phycisphaerales bacterium]